MSNYWKYREIFVRLGRVAGFEANVELYQLRRASGDKINEALPTTNRNQTMGHSSETYERYYTPTHIARHFQSIYFGTPSQEDLIRSVARMGLSRDRRALVELNDQQQEEVHNHPLLWNSGGKGIITKTSYIDKASGHLFKVKELRFTQTTSRPSVRLAAPRRSCVGSD
ncbi:hypothetical protein PSPO01_16227 [Paraphaeosphaeria sporulosa]